MRFKITVVFSIIFGFLLSALLSSAQNNDPEAIQNKVWLIHGDRQIALGEDFVDSPFNPNIVGVIIAPESVEYSEIAAAWSYGFRYGADGLDLPNYERAIEIVMERHPTWQAYLVRGSVVIYGAADADADTQDPTLTPVPESTTNP